MNESAGIEIYFVKAKVTEDYIRLFLCRRKVYLFFKRTVVIMEVRMMLL